MKGLIAKSISWLGRTRSRTIQLLRSVIEILEQTPDPASGNVLVTQVILVAVACGMSIIFDATSI